MVAIKNLLAHGPGKPTGTGDLQAAVEPGRRDPTIACGLPGLQL
ncbi:MAG: hypothetical protein OXS29_11125 [bacterium]|nr:hypothetical protein [bacterium]MDE0439661.1 hypothetical protein [bacterium]